MIAIDGSAGEGGGQILRSSLALSMLTGQPFRMHRVRAGRQKPGLLRQHLTAVQAAAEICNAAVEGAALHSQELTFHPDKVLPGEYNFDVGSAGSASLVLQTVLPPLLVGAASSTLRLAGGTHNRQAPPFDFLQKAFLPLLNRMGPQVNVDLESAGFYPAGGGRFTVSVRPTDKLRGLHLSSRGEIIRRTARAILANLPSNIGWRELTALKEELQWPHDVLQVEEIRSPGPGNALIVELQSTELTEVFTGFGERGVRAEEVARRVAHEVREYLATDAAAGVHLADQLLLPIAIAGSGSFTTMEPSLHTTTNIETIGRFLDRKFRITQHESCWEISL